MAGWPLAAGALIAAAILTKAQGLFIAPAVAAAIWTIGAPEKRAARLCGSRRGAGRHDRRDRAGGRSRRLAEHAAGARPPRDPRHAVGQRREPLVGDRLPAARALLGARHGAVGGDHRAGEDPRHPARDRDRLSGSADDRDRADDRRDRGAWIRGRLAHAAIARPRTWTILWLLAGAGAFCVHAPRRCRRRCTRTICSRRCRCWCWPRRDVAGFRPIAAAVSVVVALNLNLFYGFGDGIGYALPRAVTIVDLTVIVALFNCLLLSWHAVVLSRQCSTADARLRPPAPA